MKDLEISKELLIEVLGSEYNQRLVDWFQIEDDNFLRTYYDCGSFDDKGRPTGLGLEINIYEFAYKCKEWAYLQYGIIIQSYLYNGKWRVDILKGIEIDEFFKNIDSEPEAIIKACEWILEDLKEKT